jgi:protein gp37
MGEITKIAWADSTWNCFIGCSKVSPACDNCYAEQWAARAGRDFTKVVRASTETFHAPQRWKEPKRIFVCSLSDFFHPDILRADRHDAIRVMRHAPQHTYLLLTKRPENVKPMLLGTAWGESLPNNVWLGVTVENQEQADQRIPLLLGAAATTRFISCEPLLGAVDILGYIGSTWGKMKPSKRLCCAVLGKPQMHKAEDIYICGLPECRRPHPAVKQITPYLPLCGSHRAIAETKSVLVFVEEGLGEFRL